MFGLIGVIFLLVLFLQIGLGFSAFKAGLTLLPLPLVIIVVAPFAGRLTDRIGGRWILFAGTFISALGIYLMSDLTGSTTETSLILPLGGLRHGYGDGDGSGYDGGHGQYSGPAVRHGRRYPFHRPADGSVMGISVLGAILQNQLVGNIAKRPSSSTPDTRR